MSSSYTRRCVPISLDHIRDATNHFDEQKVLGKGGEATVYLADLYIGQKKTRVAVKHLRPNSNEFENEIETMPKIQHPNILSLLGYCDESGQKILVYEYMSKGCLSKYVKETGTSLSLSWEQRLNVCLDAARGLQYLHTKSVEFPKGIIHRDVKPDNILLDENWIAKVSDFGMFKLSHCGQTKSTVTTNLKGTQGYYAPEYLAYHSVSRKIDVYAFGVVLFQVLCRKMPWDRGDDSYFRSDDEDLQLWAQQNVDTSIKGVISQECLIVFTDIIGRSLRTDPQKRPTMDIVVLDLEKALKCQNLKDEGICFKEHTTTLSHPEPTILSFQELLLGRSSKLKEDLHKDNIPNKYSQGGEDNAVVLYTDNLNAMSECDGVKQILLLYNVDIVQRSINNRKFKKELKKLVARVSCPRLFVGGMYIGGYSRVLYLHSSKKLGPILQGSSSDDDDDDGDVNDDEALEEDEKAVAEESGEEPEEGGDEAEEELDERGEEGQQQWQLEEDKLPNKCPAGGEDKVVLYMDDQNAISEGIAMKRLLFKYNVNFEQRSINNQKFKEELEILVDKASCPRLFVRGKHIGGYAEVSDLHMSHKLQTILQGCTMH